MGVVNLYIHNATIMWVWLGVVMKVMKGRVWLCGEGVVIII